MGSTIWYHGTRDGKLRVGNSPDDFAFFTQDRSVAQSFSKYQGYKGGNASTVMKFEVKPSKTWDYNNPRHRSLIQKCLEWNVGGYGKYKNINSMRKAVKAGDYELIEDCWEAIYEAGFDSFYVEEGGVRNLAVFKKYLNRVAKPIEESNVQDKVKAILEGADVEETLRKAPLEEALSSSEVKDLLKFVELVAQRNNKRAIDMLSEMVFAQYDNWEGTLDNMEFVLKACVKAMADVKKKVVDMDSKYVEDNNG